MQFRQRDLRKQLNIDEFGRYRGGLPKYKGWTNRGGAEGAPGEFHNPMLSESQDVPDYQSVNPEIAESFKDFHQDEREYRTAKWTWIRAEVDYDFFSAKRLSRPFVWLRNFLVVAVIIPYFIGEYIRWDAVNRSNGKDCLTQKFERNTDWSR